MQELSRSNPVPQETRPVEIWILNVDAHARTIEIRRIPARLIAHNRREPRRQAEVREHQRVPLNELASSPFGHNELVTDPRDQNGTRHQWPYYRM